MTYTLDAFVEDTQAALKSTAGPAGREKVRVLLEKLLANKSFVDEAVGPNAPTGTRKLYEDEEQGFVVLAHCNPKPHKSPPHDHGSSWAVYGQAVKYTDMSEYKRLDPGRGAGEARLEKVKSYRLEPGHAGVYDVGAIHAIDYPDGSRFVRVTGRDLDYVQRLKFDMAAGKAITIESATAGAA
jgi:predicted metal-dependent enzyme (double-stranded beta helix superfamily)